MKLAGTWASLLRGVSQQPPSVRQPGQHAEQVNMLSDPVAGLTRRPGSTMLAESPLPATPASVAASLFAGGYRRVDVSTGGTEYAFLIQDAAPNPQYGTAPLPPAVVCYNLTDNLFVPTSSDAVTVAALLQVGRVGIGAAVALGRYITYAPKGQSTQATLTSAWATSTDTVAWVRGGSHDRTYSLAVQGGGTASYTTPSAYVGGAILIPTISGGVITAVRVAAGGRGYTHGQKVVFVGDGGETTVAAGFVLVDADGAVTSVLRTENGAGYSAVSCSVDTIPTGPFISPQYIAEQLRLALVALGMTATRNGSHILIGGNTGPLTATDGGDGTLLRVTGKDIDSVDRLPLMARAGHVVKVTTGPDAYFFMRAYPKGDGTVLGEVIWRESAGTVQGAVASLMLMTVSDGLVFAGPSETLAVAGAPQFVPSVAGDAESNVAPAWLRGHPITYLGVFQDRLVVAAGAAVSVSAAGDYFNFFRSSMVTVPLKDPFEMLAQGGEDDTIRHGVMYNRNLVLFGDKRQYAISGSTGLTPTSANMSIMTTYAGAATVSPVASGGQIYYVRDREGSVAVHQIQPGTFVDSAESFPASAQINDYIPAPARSLEVVAGAPALLLLRSATSQSVYTFSFLDTQDGRKQDAWSRWDFAPECGYLLTTRSTPEGVLLLWVRHHAVTGQGWLVADLLPARPAVNSPHLDSMRPHTAVLAGAGAVGAASGAAWSVVLSSSTDRYLLGDDLPATTLAADYPEAWPTAITGLGYASSVELTNPVMKDGQGVATAAGRLVITRVTVGLRESGGVVATVTQPSGDAAYTYTGRVVGQLANVVGRVPLTTYDQAVAIGRGSNDYSLTLSARSWLPLTITSVGWTGQYYNRPARA